jgi:hypothetical protein
MWERCDRLCLDSDNSSMAISPNAGGGCQINQSLELSDETHTPWWLTVPLPKPCPTSNQSSGQSTVGCLHGSHCLSQSMMLGWRSRARTSERRVPKPKQALELETT